LPSPGKSTKGQSVPATWLSRSQVIELLDRTGEEIEAMHDSDLHPERGHDGSWRYRPKEVMAVALGGSADGAVSAKAFELFEANTPTHQVLMKMKQRAAVVNSLRADYDGMVGNLVLRPATLAALRSLLGVDKLPNEEALLDAIRAGLHARHVAGFREGREDIEDAGEVIDQKTGERRRIKRRPK
jgi:hypothetical protein